MKDPDREMTETQFRQETLRGYMERGLLYARVQFGAFGTGFSPAINNTPANVARWLRQLADDIEGMEE